MSSRAPAPSNVAGAMERGCVVPARETVRASRPRHILKSGGWFSKLLRSTILASVMIMELGSSKPKQPGQNNGWIATHARTSRGSVLAVTVRGGSRSSPARLEGRRTSERSPLISTAVRVIRPGCVFCFSFLWRRDVCPLTVLRSILYTPAIIQSHKWNQNGQLLPSFSGLIVSTDD